MNIIPSLRIQPAAMTRPRSGEDGAKPKDVQTSQRAEAAVNASEQANQTNESAKAAQRAAQQNLDTKRQDVKQTVAQPEPPSMNTGFDAQA